MHPPKKGFVIVLLRCYGTGKNLQSARTHAMPTMSGEIRHLFVTLKRGFAGTREAHVKIVKALGLRKRQQTIKKHNTASVRGAIDKVQH